MRKMVLSVVAAFLVFAVVFAAVGCGASFTPRQEWTEQLKSQGIEAESLDLTEGDVRHGSQIMMDRMILDSHGIDSDGDSHGLITLKNGEEVAAVMYRGEIYTYKNPE